MEKKTKYTVIAGCRDSGKQAECYQTGYVNTYNNAVATLIITLLELGALMIIGEMTDDLIINVAETTITAQKIVTSLGQ